MRESRGTSNSPANALPFSAATACSAASPRQMSSTNTLATSPDGRSSDGFGRYCRRIEQRNRSGEVPLVGRPFPHRARPGTGTRRWIPSYRPRRETGRMDAGYTNRSIHSRSWLPGPRNRHRGCSKGGPWGICRPLKIPWSHKRLGLRRKGSAESRGRVGSAMQATIAALALALAEIPG